MPNLQLEQLKSYGRKLVAPISLMRWTDDGKYLGIVADKMYFRWKYRSKGDFMFSKRIRGTEETTDINQTQSHLTSVYRGHQISIQRLGRGYVPIPWRKYAEKFKALAWSPNQEMIAASISNELLVFNVATRKPMRLKRRVQTDTPIIAICWSPDSRYVIACTQGREVHITNVKSRQLVTVFHHTSQILQVAVSHDNQYLVLGSRDCVITIYNLQTIKDNQTPIAVLPGMGAVAKSFDFSADSSLLAARLDNEYVYVWSMKTQKLVDIIHSQCNRSNGLAFNPKRPKLAISVNIDGKHTFRVYSIPKDIHTRKPQVEIIKKRVAKIMIVGDRYVGKTFVFNHLVRQTSESDLINDNIAIIEDDNALAAPDGELGTRLEMWLWDSPSAPESLVLSELELRNISLALIVFDGTKDSFRASVHHWLNRLRRIQQGFDTSTSSILVESKSSEGLSNVLEDGVVQTDIPHRTVVKVNSEGHDAETLLDEIFKAINWEDIPEGVYTRQFDEISNFLIDLQKTDNDILISISQLFNRYMASLDEDTLLSEEEIFQEFESCIVFLELQGIVRRFRYGGLILLHPDVLQRYISSILEYVDSHDEFGAITIQDILTIDLDMSPRYTMDNQYLENALRIAIVDDLLSNDVAHREGDILHFPHMYQSPFSRLDVKGSKPNYIYEVDEPVGIIYSQIVNRLRLLPDWELDGLGQGGASFLTPEGESFVISYNTSDYAGSISLSFTQHVHPYSRCLLDLAVQLYLKELTLSAEVDKTHIYYCESCGKRLTPAQSRAVKNLESTRDVIACTCGQPIRITDDCAETELGQRLREQFAEVSASLHDVREERMKEILLQNKARLHMYDALFILDSADKNYVQHTIYNFLQKQYAILAKLETDTLNATDIIQRRNYDERVVYFLGNSPMTQQTRDEILRLAETIGTVNRKIILVMLGSGVRAEELYQHRNIELKIMFDDKDLQLEVLNSLARELITVL